MVKIEVSERTAVVPKNYVGQNILFKIVKDDNIDDCVRETERESKKNSGKFTQYSLLLENKAGEQFEVNYLFARDLRNLVKEYGEDTKAWNNCGVEATGSPREDGEKLYYDIVLTPKTLPAEWLTENVA